MRSVDALTLQALCADLHDNIAQSLAAVKLQLQSLMQQSEYPLLETREKLQRAHVTTRTANAELRRIIEQLRDAGSPMPMRPPSKVGITPSSQKLIAIDRLRRLGLVASLRAYLRHALGARCTLLLHSLHYQPQDLALELTLFRIVQEACSNAVRHAQTSEIAIRLCCHELPGSVLLHIDDNGGGQVSQFTPGFGLVSMRARVDALGGSFALQQLEKGISLRVTLPVQQQTQDARAAVQLS
jgi:signal transduction histidine kinase